MMPFKKKCAKKQTRIRVLFAVLLCFALMILLTPGCIRRVIIPKFPNKLTLNTLSLQQTIHVKFHGIDHQVALDVVASVNHAMNVMKQWGTLTTPITIRIFPSHGSLEEAVLRRYKWLRAWALYNEVYLQSPRTWNIKYYQSDLLELLTHELTHVVMYQLCCQQQSWFKRPIPFWFREGMASYTAHQGYRRYKKLLPEFLRKPIGKKVLQRPSRHLHRHQGMAYSIAHWMFVDFIKKWKLKGARQLLEMMRTGKTFDGAFQKITGMTNKTFKKRFMEYESSRIAGRSIFRKQRLSKSTQPSSATKGKMGLCALHDSPRAKGTQEQPSTSDSTWR